MNYVDVHAHLCDQLFESDSWEVLKRAEEQGLLAVVNNGLDKKTNEKVLLLAKESSLAKPACGIYPLRAMWENLPEELKNPSHEPFSVREELQVLEELAKKGQILALGECGLDDHGKMGKDFLKFQEPIFEHIVDLGIRYDLPVIVHSRGAECRVFEILQSLGAKRVVWHSYMGRTGWISSWIQDRPLWMVSIPAHVVRNPLLQKLVCLLNREQILTETDAPYLSPIKGERNEPSMVVKGVSLCAEVRKISPEDFASQIMNNYERMFSSSLG